MNRTQRRKEQRKKKVEKFVPSSEHTATSSGAHWEWVYVPAPEGTVGLSPAPSEPEVKP